MSPHDSMVGTITQEMWCIPCATTTIKDQRPWQEARAVLHLAKKRRILSAAGGWHQVKPARQRHTAAALLPNGRGSKFESHQFATIHASVMLSADVSPRGYGWVLYNTSRHSVAA